MGDHQCSARCDKCNPCSSEALQMRSEGVCDIIWRRKKPKPTELQRPKGRGVDENGRPCEEFHHRTVIPSVEVDEMRTLHDVAGLGYRRIARVFKRSESTVRDIVSYSRRVSRVVRITKQ